MSVTTVTSANFKDEVLEASRTTPVLIDFWASWCGPCRMLSPIIDEIAEEKGDSLKVCKVNVDEESELASQFGVMSIPTLVIVKDGAVAKESVGVKPKAAILSMLA